MMQRYAGIVSVSESSDSFIFVIELNIRNPTNTRAGAVANDGIAVNTGASSVDSKNSIPVVTAVRPVRPPAPTPDADSTNVVVLVPRTAPAVVAIASERRAGRMPGSFPSLSSISAFVATPISVPRVSKISTNRNEKTTMIKLKMPTLSKPTLKH